MTCSPTVRSSVTDRCVVFRRPRPYRGTNARGTITCPAVISWLIVASCLCGSNQSVLSRPRSRLHAVVVYFVCRMGESDEFSREKLYHAQCSCSRKCIHHHHKLPQIFSTYFTKNSMFHTYNIRTKEGLHIDFIRSSFGQRCISSSSSK